MPGFLQILKRLVCCKGGDQVDRNHPYPTTASNTELVRVPHKLVDDSNVKPEIDEKPHSDYKKADNAIKLKRKRPKSPNKTSNEEIWVQKGTIPQTFSVPVDDFRDLIKKGIIPQVLNTPLTPSTYRDYFNALICAEGYYIEKWNGYSLRNTILKLHNPLASKNRNLIADDGKEDFFFEIDIIPEKVPFLVPGDTVLARPAGRNVKPFQGRLFRVVKNYVVITGFGDDFHSRHLPNCVYDVSFSFDRFCLKRCVQAVEAAMDPLFLDFLFPNPESTISFFIPPYPIPSHPNLDYIQASTIYHLSRLKSTPPYLIEGPRSVTPAKNLSRTGLVIQQAVLQISRMSPSCRILVNAPSNSTCDVLMRGLLNEIPESDIFRANAAYRELDGVPYDILSLCPIKGGCFSCPSLHELQNFKVILSTYVSSYRLQNEGLSAGHFTHIFLLDASSATEPETMIVLASLADAKTIVVVSGSATEFPNRVRSYIAQTNGLRVSYFQRLFESEPYSSRDPMFFTSLGRIRQH